MTIVGYLLNLACWEGMQVRLLNQNQIWKKEKGKKKVFISCKNTEAVQSHKPCRCAYQTHTKMLAPGRSWHARKLCQSKHGVSRSVGSIRDAIDGNDWSRRAILEPKDVCKALHGEAYLSGQDGCVNMHCSRHMKFFPLRRNKKHMRNCSTRCCEASLQKVCQRMMRM